MSVWRRWIFPILGVLIGTAIAVALVRLAFFPDSVASAEQPYAEIQNPLVPVERGSVVNELALTGSIARDAEYAIKSGVNGTVTSVDVGAGALVAAGQVLYTVRQDAPRKTVQITAGEAGTITELGLVAGQAASIGADVATLSPARFHVLSTVEPVQLYRLINAPAEATVTITGGPAPFSCTGLTTQVSDDGTTSVRCAIPADQVVFPGLPAELTVAVGSVDDALIIPTTAVKGGAGSGMVWIDAGDGSEPTEQPVTLGLTDGTMVEVLEGLAEGDLIRQFVPGIAVEVQEICYEIAPGQEVCEPGNSW